jgi:hypothetical protein
MVKALTSWEGLCLNNGILMEYSRPAKEEALKGEIVRRREG